MPIPSWIKQRYAERWKHISALLLEQDREMHQNNITEAEYLELGKNRKVVNYLIAKGKRDGLSQVVKSLKSCERDWDGQ